MPYTSEVNIRIILGSTRRGRFGEHPARWMLDRTAGMDGVRAVLLDLRDYPLPFFDEPVSPSRFEGNYPTEAIARWAAEVEAADGFVIVTPEYNHGYPAVLKNALDSVYDPWKRKAVGFVSYGGVGGARSVEQLREVAVELQMAPVRSAVHIPAPWTLLDGHGVLKPDAFDPFTKNAEALLADLVWWARALRTARRAS